MATGCPAVLRAPVREQSPSISPNGIWKRSANTQPSGSRPAWSPTLCTDAVNASPLSRRPRLGGANRRPTRPWAGRRVTHLCLVRHGATGWHAENRYAGSSDVSLDPNGYAQAERLAAWASEPKLAAIWCSPLTRARETAAAAARATGLVPHADERLREIDFGQIEGKTMAEAEELFPEEIRRFKADPATYPMPGGEDPHEAAHRVV